MEEKIKVQEKALAKAQEKALALRLHSRKPDTILGIVNAINRLTGAVLLVARVTDPAARERWNRDNLEAERRAR